MVQAVPESALSARQILLEAIQIGGGWCLRMLEGGFQWEVKFVFFCPRSRGVILKLVGGVLAQISSVVLDVLGFAFAIKKGSTKGPGFEDERAKPSL